MRCCLSPRGQKLKCALLAGETLEHLKGVFGDKPYIGLSFPIPEDMVKDDASKSFQWTLEKVYGKVDLIRIKSELKMEYLNTDVKDANGLSRAGTWMDTSAGVRTTMPTAKFSHTTHLHSCANQLSHLRT